MIDIVGLAHESGFSACFVLPPDNFTCYKRRQADGVLHAQGQHLCAEPTLDYPWANALILLLWPYRPYRQDACTAGAYYAASNEAYHAARTLAKRLAARGVRAEQVYVPVRELALRNGVGTMCKNGLTAFENYGTRVAVQVLAASVPDVMYEPVRPMRTCPDCGNCQSVCPVHAIGKDGFDYQKCMRAHMGKDVLPDWVMQNLESMLGCELCQYACPLNAGIVPLEGVPEAFEVGQILETGVKELTALIGPNQNGGGRILCHAAVLAARQGRRDLLPALQRLTDDPREPVKAAAIYAISLLQGMGDCDTMIE